MDTTPEQNNVAADASTREQSQLQPQLSVVNVVESDAERKNFNGTTTTTTTMNKNKKSVSFGTLEVKYVLNHRNIMTKQAKNAYWYNSQDYKVFQKDYEYDIKRDIQKRSTYHAKKLVKTQAEKEKRKNKKMKYNDHNNSNDITTLPKMDDSMGAFAGSFANRMHINKDDDITNKKFNTSSIRSTTATSTMTIKRSGAIDIPYYF
jgi:hypothetical protein